MANVMTPEEQDDGYYGMLAWCLLTWLIMELLFLGIILVFLAPRMNQLEPPAKVSPLSLCFVIRTLSYMSATPPRRFS